MPARTDPTSNDTVPDDAGPATEPSGLATAAPGAQNADGRDAAGSRAGTDTALPDAPPGSMFERKRLLWFGSLAAAGTLGVLQWPVVVAIGAGTVVAERFARDGLTGPAS